MLLVDLNLSVKIKHFDLCSSVFILESSMKTAICLQKYVFGIFWIHLKKTCIMPKEVTFQEIFY